MADNERMAFWSRVRKTKACWLWLGGKTTRGYARFTYRGTRRYAYRVAWEWQHNKPFPQGLEPDHLCRNHACVRPSHIDPVTHVVNMSRGAHALKRRCPRGHRYTKANTYIHRNRRHCRACHRAAVRRAS